MRLRLAPPLLLLACNGGFTGSDKGPALDSDSGSADTGADTGDTADSGDTGGDSGDTALATSTWNWVLGSIVVGSPSSGFDFDGDGQPDNGASALSGFLDSVFEDALATGDTLTVVQLSGVQGWSDDEIGVAMFTVVDTDLDPSDNFGGSEDLFAGAEIDDEGVAVSAIPTEIIGGGYGLELAVARMDIGDIELTSRVAIKLSGYASESSHTGLIGLGIPLSSMQALGQEYAADGRTLQAIDNSPDLDLDGDGTPETISASLAFTGSPCTLR